MCAARHDLRGLVRSGHVWPARFTIIKTCASVSLTLISGEPREVQIWTLVGEIWAAGGGQGRAQAG